MSEEPSIFTKIIRGDIPAYKIYEDDHAVAFLDIAPTQPGHTLVVPKVQVDRLENLSDNEYQALMAAVRAVMKRVVEVYGAEYRACLKVIGFDVPHAHVHVIPCQSGKEFHHFDPDAQPAPDDELAAVAEKLRF